MTNHTKLPKGWREFSFDQVLSDQTRRSKKIPLAEYASKGVLPVIDQGEQFIAGYTDKTECAFTGDLPVILFGDHTRRFKYVDFPFVLGADGVKILKSLMGVPEFVYYWLLQSDIPNRGYQRHFRYVKELSFIFPPTIAEQERIVEVLRQADAIRRKRAEARRLADQILPALFLDMFGDPITNPKNWPVDRLGNYIAEWQAGFASGKKDVEDGVRQLRMNNITTNGWINLDLVRTVARHKKHEHYLARKGDVIFNNTNSPELVGKTILFLEEDEFYFSNHLSRIRTTERVTNEWMAGLLHALWTKDVFKGLCRQWVNQASVSKESVFALEVPIPSPTALQNHQEALEYVSTRRDAFAISHEDAERLFSVLLSRAFTGELTAQDMNAMGQC